MGLLSVLGIDMQDPVATVVMDCQPVLRWTAGLSCDGLLVCLAMDCGRRQGLSPLILWFVHSQVCIIFVLHEVAFGQVILHVLQFSSVIIPLILHTHSCIGH
jgi:hypothetical protein